jgi:hypothetical protein
MVQKSEELFVTKASRRFAPVLLVELVVGPLFVVQEAPKINKQPTNDAISVNFFMRFSVSF